MSLTIFSLLSLFALTATCFMLFARSLRLMLLGWSLASLAFVIFFFLLNSPLLAILQVLFTFCLGFSLQTAIKHCPPSEKHAVSRGTAFTVTIVALLSLTITGLISVRLWTSSHTPFPPTQDSSQIVDTLLTGQPLLLVFCAALLILASLVSLVVFTRKEEP